MAHPEKCEWQISGMDCAACATKIRTAVARLPGVSDVDLGLMSEKLRVTLDPGATSRQAVEDTVQKLGYGIGAHAAAGHDHDHDHEHDHNDATPVAGQIADPPWYRQPKGRLVALTGAVLALAWGASLVAPAVAQAAFTVACLIGLVPVARKAWAALRTGQPFTIESLMTIAAFGALLIGAAAEAALVVFLFAVGEVLEGVAANRARSGIRALSALVPKTALLDDGSTVPAAALRPGQILRIRPGDRVPADGEIIEGTSGLDESPVTGESIPVTRGPGDSVFAGSVNTEAVLRVRVTRASDDNTISRIIRLIEEAEDARAPTERFIDRFSRWYMPAIVTVAALVIILPPVVTGADWGTWLYRGLALLLIGCPCALVISVPASIASALSTGARHGLLMKGGTVLEATATVRTLAFDKTGTLTRGQPVVTDVIPLNGATRDEALALAAAIEAGSSHPLARAVTAACTTPVPTATDARALPGRGVEANVGGATAWVASPAQATADGALAQAALDQAAGLEAQGKTVVVVYRAGDARGLIALRDEPRPDAADAMRQLRDLNITPIMLTGDNPRTAQAIAQDLGMEFRAQMLPEHKLAAIRDMSANGVMMIGDGINDAPALKQATVGVAMGSGTDVALETADAAVLRDRLTDVAAQIRLARTTMSNIHQNLTIALGLKAVFLVTSVLGVTGLWPAIMADTGATVLVTLNALRLLRYDPTRS